MHDDAFDVFPLREDYRCTPQSVASHTLYENADSCDFARAARANSTWVQCSRFTPPEYTIKLEGVRQGGYSTILMGGVRDPFILAGLDDWLKQLDDNIRVRVASMVGNRHYEIVTRVYGRDGVMGALEPERKSAATRSSSCGM